MAHTPIATKEAPAAIGPYSQAVLAERGRLVACSGQIALDPVSGELRGAADARVQTEQVLENLRQVLAAAGATFEHVVKTTVYLTDLQDFGAMNEVYARYFSGTHPARATLGVAALPKGALVEIEALAVIP